MSKVLSIIFSTFLLLTPFIPLTSGSVDLSLFMEECPCLMAYDVSALFITFSIDLESCFATSIGYADCVAFSYCVRPLQFEIKSKMTF